MIRLPETWSVLRENSHTTFLRPRPVIQPDKCTGCGKCAKRCPARAIEQTTSGSYRIALGACADCGCCLKVCEDDAISLQFRGVAKLARVTLRRQTAIPGAFEQIRAHVIRLLVDTRREQTVTEVVSGILSKLNRLYADSIVNELLDDLVVQGLATKTDSQGHCRYRWANLASTVS